MKQIHLISGPNVKKENIKGALELDYLCYEEKYYLDLETCFSYYEKNPWIYFMALNESNSVIGYVNLSPILKKTYDELKSGKELDTCIVADDIVSYRKDQDCYLYYSSICVHPEWRNKGIANILLAQTDSFIEKLVADHINIKGIIADAVSDVGKKILECRGFSEVCISNHQSVIMEKRYD